MLSHDFTDMPGKGTEIGDNFNETVMMLRCKWCLKRPTKAREDGCPIRELEENGKIILSLFNPEGVAYFHGRVCVTCEGPIMGHFLRRNSPHYWCHETEAKFSEGINNCVFDVEGVTVPEEPQEPKNDRDDLPMVQETDPQG